MKNQRTKSNLSYKFNYILALSLLAILLIAPAAQAGDPDQKSPRGTQASLAGETTQSPSSTAAITGDDGGSWELGLHGSAGNLTQATAAERYGMQYWLNGWFVTRHNYPEGSAWEEDFKMASRGGKENSYIDAVDLQFYVGHGAPALFTFDNATHDDSTMNASIDCNASWGDGDNDWLALTSCQVLANTGIGAMAQCMNRQHLILGFVTNAAAHNNYWDTQAYHFGWRLRHNYNMTQAWFGGCDVAQRGRTTRVIAEETACFNDNPYSGSVCADSADNDYYWYTHSCGTETASYIPVERVEAVPVFKIDPYSLDEQQADLRTLQGAFGVTGTVQAAGFDEGPGTPPGAPADNTFLTSVNMSKTLEMDKGSGMYQYADLSQLWNQSQAEAAFAVNAASVNYINSDVAKQVADQFLQNNHLMENGAQFFEVVTDTVGTLPRGIVSAASVQDAEVPSVWQVIYTRKLTATVVTAAGVTEDLSFTVVGPGAKQKVYVPLTGQVNAAGILEAQPVGAQGGWRDVSAAVNAASGQQIMTTIIASDTAKQLYLALDKEVTMNSLPMEIKSQEILSQTLAYWENAPGSSQGELIPVYEMKVRLTDKNSNAVTEDFVYVPAAAEYMRPLARISSIITAPVIPASEITLDAVDASKTLKTIDPVKLAAFDFVMGSGNPDNYLYEWYVGSVDPANRVPSAQTSNGGRTVKIKVPVSNDGKGGEMNVFLRVIDSVSANKSSNTGVMTLQVNESVFLPLAVK